MTIALTFLVSLTSKLRGPRAWRRFAESAARLAPGGPPAWRAGRRDALAALVAAVELAVVALLIALATVAAGLATALVTLLVFSIVLRRAIRRGLRAPCACFGGRASPIGTADLYRNALLGVVAATGLTLTLTGAAQGTPEPAGVVVSSLAALLVTTVAVLSGDIGDLLRPAGQRR
jgi:hypothetical protein